MKMEQTSENMELSVVIDDADIEVLMKKTNNGFNSNKCNQCNYASLNTVNLRFHLRTHRAEKPKNDQRNSGGTLRQKFNLIDI